MANSDTIDDSIEKFLDYIIGQFVLSHGQYELAKQMRTDYNAEVDKELQILIISALVNSSMVNLCKLINKKEELSLDRLIKKLKCNNMYTDNMTPRLNRASVKSIVDARNQCYAHADKKNIAREFTNLQISEIDTVMNEVARALNIIHKTVRGAPAWGWDLKRGNYHIRNTRLALMQYDIKDR